MAGSIKRDGWEYSENAYYRNEAMVKRDRCFPYLRIAWWVWPPGADEADTAQALGPYTKAIDAMVAWEDLEGTT